MRFARDERNTNRDLTSVNARKIYDSCASKDYLENLRCFFLESQQSMVDQAENIKVKNVNVISAEVDIENVQFRDGLFSISQTFFFKVESEVISAENSTFLNSLCIFSKTINLFGGESNVKTFHSGELTINDSNETLPLVVLQVSKPVILASSLEDVTASMEVERAPNIPNRIREYFGGNFAYVDVSKYLSVSLGLFSITHLERDMQILMPLCDLGNPKKVCNSGISAREAFNQIRFPTNDFFP